MVCLFSYPLFHKKLAECLIMNELLKYTKTNLKLLKNNSLKIIATDFHDLLILRKGGTYYVHKYS